MWVLLSRRLRTWVLLGVALPLAGVLAREVAERIEQHHGSSTRTTRALRHAGELAGRRGVGPLGRPNPGSGELAPVGRPRSRWHRR